MDGLVGVWLGLYIFGLVWVGMGVCVLYVWFGLVVGCLGWCVLVGGVGYGLGLCVGMVAPWSLMGVGCPGLRVGLSLPALLGLP